MKKTLPILALLLILLIALTVLMIFRVLSNSKAENTPAPTEAVITETPPPVTVIEPTPTPTPTSTPVPPPTPSPTPETTATPEPTPTPTPTPAPTPTPSNLPRVTKSPTDEKVAVNGSCQFVTKYENAKWAEWHFVSPDGTRDLDYKAAAKEFTTLEIVNGFAKDMTLKNIPEALNGWKVYYRFSNANGFVNTQSAKITVTTDTAAGAPKVTKSPTGETVKVGDGAWFVAKHEDAIWAVWHFVSPDGTRDLDYKDAAKEFPNLQIINGDKPTLQLKNIPAELNGWKVYCAFRNNVGTTNTNAAAITVTGGTAAPATTPAAQQQGFEGRWVGEIAGRCSLTMTYKSEGCQSVDITWSGSAADKSRWTMTANVTRNDIMEYTDGHYWAEKYTDDTHYTVQEEAYNQTGRFYLQDGKLHWVNDNTKEETILIRN